MTLANKIAAEIGRSRRPLTDIDEELDKHLTFIEENYGTIAINKIVMTEMDGFKTSNSKKSPYICDYVTCYAGLFFIHSMEMKIEKRLPEGSL